MFDSIFAAEAVEASFTLATLAASMGTSFAAGLLIAFVYVKTSADRVPSRGFAMTLALLPAVITVVILLVGNNVARAFSLAGTFTLIRFRSAPGEPKDIMRVLFCLAVGLASGRGFLMYAAICCVAFCAASAILELSGFGKVKTVEQRLLKITVPEDLNFKQAFDVILQKYTSSYIMKRVKTADLGSVYELTYSVHMRDGADEKDFIDELRTRNGNMNIALLYDAPPQPAFAEF